MDPRENSKMKFSDDEWRSRARSDESQTPKIVQWVMKYSGGLIRNEKQAVYILIGFVIIAFVFTFIFVSKTKTQPLTQAQINQIIKNQQNMYGPAR